MAYTADCLLKKPGIQTAILAIEAEAVDTPESLGLPVLDLIHMSRFPSIVLTISGLDSMTTAASCTA